MASPTDRVQVTDAASAVFEGLEGVAATLINRGPNPCVIAETEAKCAVGSGPEDHTVDSFYLAVGDYVEVDVEGQDDDVWAVCATGETATLHIIGAKSGA